MWAIPLPADKQEEKIDLQMKRFEVTADVLASCVFVVEAHTDLEARELVEAEKFQRRKKITYATSPVVTDVKEIKNGNK